MRVRAIMDGYYGDVFRKTGAEFELYPILYVDKKTGKPASISPEAQFSHVWMVAVDSPTPPQLREPAWEASVKLEEEGGLRVAPPPPPSALPQQPVPIRAPDAPSITKQQEDSSPTGDKEVL